MNGYWFDFRKQMAQRAARMRERERRATEERQTRQDALVAIGAVLGMLLALLAGVLISDSSVRTGVQQYRQSSASIQLASTGSSGLTIADFTDMTALERQVGVPCEARYSWPVEKATIAESFDRPATPWAPGHRGVDLLTETKQVIMAPNDGTVSFAGRVGGKDVVSIRHRGGVTSTFEPAVTELAVGASVQRGDAIGAVQGDSDHCEESCLHWGLKRGAHDYLDPKAYAVKQKIVLKE